MTLYVQPQIDRRPFVLSSPSWLAGAVAELRTLRIRLRSRSWRREREERLRRIAAAAAR
jgi:hypothetical protein